MVGFNINRSSTALARRALCMVGNPEVLTKSLSKTREGKTDLPVTAVTDHSHNQATLVG